MGDNSGRVLLESVVSPAQFDLGPFLGRLREIVVQPHHVMVYRGEGSLADGLAARVDAMQTWLGGAMGIVDHVELQAVDAAAHDALHMLVLRAVVLHALVDGHRCGETLRHGAVVIVHQSVVGHDAPVHEHHVTRLVPLHHRLDLLLALQVQQLVEVEETDPGILVAMLLVAVIKTAALHVRAVVYVGQLHQSGIYVVLKHVLQTLLVAVAVVIDEHLLHADLLVVLHPLPGIAVLLTAYHADGHVMDAAHLRRGLPQLAVLVQPLLLLAQVGLLP